MGKLIIGFTMSLDGFISSQNATVLVLSLPKMSKLSRKLKPPFVTAITRAGEVLPR